MDITPYVDRLRHDLAQAASTSDDATQAAAERLGLALGSAIRLTLMEALAEATAEITSDMHTGAVEVRLAGRDLEFVVTGAPPDVAEPATPPSAAAEEETDDDGATARITLRLPESLKARAEQAAAAASRSLNTWIVDAVRQATRDRAVTVDVDLSAIPFLDADRPGRGRARSRSRRMTGWV